jgi:hypothetical protein
MVLANLVVLDVLEDSLLFLDGVRDRLVPQEFLFHGILDVLYRRHVRALRGVEDIPDTIVAFKQRWFIEILF